MIVAVILVLTLSLHQSNALSQNATQFCWTDPTTSKLKMMFILFPNDDTIGTVFASDDSTCTVTAEADGTYRKTFHPADGECAAISENGGYTASFRTKALPNAYVFTDKIYNLFCNASQFFVLPNDSQSSDVAALSDPNPEQSEVGDVDGPILDVVQKDGDGVWKFGESVTLRMRLTNTAVIKGVKPINCDAAPNTLFRGDSTLKLYINGCNNDLSGVFNSSIVGSHGFTEDTSRDKDLEPFAIQTESMHLFKFVGESTIVVRCTYEYCFDTVDPCLESCSSRRRRSVRNRYVNTTREVVAVINFNEIVSPGLKADEKFPDVPEVCSKPIIYVTALCVLALLLVFSLIVSFYSCFKLNQSTAVKTVSSRS